MKMEMVRRILMGVGAFAFAGTVNATVLNFDDVQAGSTLSGYGGFSWDQFAVSDYASAGYGNASTSGNQYAYNTWANVASVHDTAFDFNGANFTGAWNDGLSIAVTGYQGGIEKYNQIIVVNTTEAKWFDFNFIGIDALKFASFGGTPNINYFGIGSGTHFAMDDFTFNEGHAVPEPATTVLLGAGLAGLMLRRRKA